MYMYISIYIYIYVCIYMYVCVYRVNPAISFTCSGEGSQTQTKRVVTCFVTVFLLPGSFFFGCLGKSPDERRLFKANVCVDLLSPLLP